MAKDYLQSMKYHIVGVPTNGNTFPITSAGFSAVTIPEMTAEVAEYREGLTKFTIKQGGIPAVSDVTLSKGVVKGESDFCKWMLDFISGNEYRYDFTIHHLHRDDFAEETPFGTVKYEIKNAIPIRVKPGGDLDASTSDISIREMDIACEWFDIENTSAADYKFAP